MRWSEIAFARRPTECRTSASSPRASGWNCQHKRKGSTSYFSFGSAGLMRSRLRNGTMKFDDLDDKMRRFETAHDHCVLPGIFMVARIDGRGFTRLTKEVHEFEAPFDEKFRGYMIATLEHLM